MTMKKKDSPPSDDGVSIKDAKDAPPFARKGRGSAKRSSRKSSRK